MFRICSLFERLNVMIATCTHESRNIIHVARCVALESMFAYSFVRDGAMPVAITVVVVVVT